MRISDWSSDVCSSDLILIRVLRLGRFTLCRSGLTHLFSGRKRRRESCRPKNHLNSCLWVAPSDEKALTCCLKHICRVSPRAMLSDRKSVVQGTSVSVRVVLGGGRFIKKTKKS